MSETDEAKHSGSDEEGGINIKLSIEDAAYHEAGHAAMALAVRKKFSYVSIQPNENHAGVVWMSRDKAFQQSHYVETRYGEFKERKVDIGGHLEKHILILVSGYVAQNIYLEMAGANDRWLNAHYGSSEDYKRAYDHAVDILKRNLQHKFTTRCVTPEDIVGSLKTDAYLWLQKPTIWPGVQALANALLMKTTLRYKEARQIFADAFAVEGRATK